MVDKNENFFAPLLDWSLPYNKQLMAWTTDPCENIHVGTDGLTADHLAKRDPTAYLIEAPMGTWAAWVIKGSKVFVALAMPDPEHDNSDLFKRYIKTQRQRLGIMDDIALQEVKVPPCDSAHNSGVAALANCHWLLATKKRAHPGALQYLRQREEDYNKYTKLVSPVKTQDE